MRHWLDVVDVLFRYIGMLRREGPQEWVFREIRDIANIQYRRVLPKTLLHSVAALVSVTFSACEGGRDSSILQQMWVDLQRFVRSATDGSLVRAVHARNKKF